MDTTAIETEVARVAIIAAMGVWTFFGLGIFCGMFLMTFCTETSCLKKDLSRSLLLLIVPLWGPMTIFILPAVILWMYVQKKREQSNKETSQEERATRQALKAEIP